MTHLLAAASVWFAWILDLAQGCLTPEPGALRHWGTDAGGGGLTSKTVPFLWG
jgi:hypothetical protein